MEFIILLGKVKEKIQIVEAKRIAIGYLSTLLRRDKDHEVNSDGTEQR